jgi:cell wall-associated NlpC family hydrolase
LPLAQTWDGWWEVRVASAGEEGKAEIRTSRIPRAAAAPFPVAFNKKNLALIGDQLLGQPYGWGEQYDLRDCSALLRDFLMPFGIWLPRASSEQIASVPRRLPLAAVAPPEKEKLIMSRALPFLTLLYKPGHIMLYAGEDRERRPLAFHGSWSIRVKEGEGARKQIIGISAITSLAPGKELGLVPGSSLLDKVTELGTITERCSAAK